MCGISAKLCVEKINAIIMYTKFEMMGAEATMVYLTSLSRQSSGTTGENHENP
jgi:hypothetical protein